MECHRSKMHLSFFPNFFFLTVLLTFQKNTMTSLGSGNSCLQQLQNFVAYKRMATQKKAFYCLVNSSCCHLDLKLGSYMLVTHLHEIQALFQYMLSQKYSHLQGTIYKDY